MNETQKETGLAIKAKNKAKKVPLYNVILHNDKYTTMEFVIYIMQNVFNKTIEQAEQDTWAIHTEGKKIVGTYIEEIAKTKQQEVSLLADREGHPLRCTIEEAAQPSITPRSRKP